ncbi:transcription factor with AP2 domain-containing protein [Babesia ovata]|uniref:Transcription factor with AP2 domain-containing protein n=1 Tax=Babesia ovata TaxID=189622 RepID=A0A2H6KAX5_9APIC|nr:transcription factor with AP2 domain-containing protein [Babesia ovata]GBE60136.1 transcription factor with AP2 domain-containing protein [Babesia ovata]
MRDNATPHGGEIHAANYGRDHYASDPMMVTRSSEEQPGTMLLPPFAMMSEDVKGASHMPYDHDMQQAYKHYCMAMAASAAAQRYNLGTTLGYDSLPINAAWSREQIGEHLMIMKQQEAASMPHARPWMPMPTKRTFNDVNMREGYGTAGGRMAPMPHVQDRMDAQKRRAMAEMHMQQRQKHFNTYMPYDTRQVATFRGQTVSGSGHRPNMTSHCFGEDVEHNIKASQGSVALNETIVVPPQVPMCRMDTRIISTDEGSQQSTIPSDVESEFEFNEAPAAHPRKKTVHRAPYSLTRCDSTLTGTAADNDFDWKRFKPSEGSQEEDKLSFSQTLSGSLKQDYINFTKHGVLSNELRQEYIRRSKLYPKVRGVWFNSTVRRMGWVGQAYKKCKRIEKIFSISKHGFDGARELAIAFRNSQKPTAGASAVTEDVMLPLDTTYSATTNDDFAVTETVGPIKTEDAVEMYESYEGATQQTEEFAEQPTEYADALAQQEFDRPGKPLRREDLECDDSHTDEEQEEAMNDGLKASGFSEGMLEQYKSSLTEEQREHRDHLCKGALRLMLYELAALVELDVPIPRLGREACCRGLQYHIDALEACQSATDMLPYVAIFGNYICRGITPVDIPFGELYTMLQALSFCRPLGGSFNSNTSAPFVTETAETNISDLIVV